MHFRLSLGYRAQGKRGHSGGGREGPLVMTSFIPKVAPRQLAPFFFPKKGGSFLPCGCRCPALSGTLVDVQFLERAVWLFMVW